MKILVLSIVGFQVAINNGNNVCALIRIDLLVLQVSHGVLARGQQGSKLFDNLSTFRPCFFMNTLPILMEILAFSMRLAPIILFLISAPIFPYFERPGRLKGRIRYHVSTVHSITARIPCPNCQTINFHSTIA